jgi:hypothetical protein
MASKYTVPGLAPEKAERVATVLQDRLTMTLDLHLTLKHVHWNVVGPNFIAVHEMLDPQVDAVRAMSDAIAERIATHGYEPMGWHEESDDEPTVTFEDEGLAPPDGDRLLPLHDGGAADAQPFERDGREYQVRADITWVEDVTPHDKKRFRITVKWTDYGLERSVTHEARRAAPAGEVDYEGSFTSFESIVSLGHISDPSGDAGKLEKKVDIDDDGNATTTSVNDDDINMIARTSCAAGPPGRRGDRRGSRQSLQAECRPR